MMSLKIHSIFWLLYVILPTGVYSQLPTVDNVQVPSNYSVQENSSLVLTCTYSLGGTPFGPLIRWEKPGDNKEIYYKYEGGNNPPTYGPGAGYNNKFKLASNISAIRTTLAVELMNAQLRDGRPYRCYVQHGPAAGLDDTTVSVLVPPQPVMTGPASNTVTAGVQYSMTCSVNRAKPNFHIEWVGKTQPQLGTEGSGVYWSNLQHPFNENRASTRVTHTCRVTWDNETGSGDTVINQNIDINVQYGPHTEATGPAETNTVEEGSATLTCNVTSASPSSPIAITWKHNTTITISAGGRYELTNNNLQLKINNLDLSDDGVYACHGDNGVSGADSLSGYTMRVQGKPRVAIHEVTPGPNPVVGSRMTLKCILNFARPAQILGTAWRKNGTIITGAVQDELVLDLVQRSDTGVYVCEKRNVIGTGSSPGSPVVVHAGATIEDPTSSVTYRPRYNDPKFNMSCTASASNVINFTWKKNSAAVTQSDFIEYSKIIDGTFKYGLEKATINTLKWKTKNEEEYKCDNVAYYSGTYKCTATATAAGQSVPANSPDVTVDVEYPAFFKGEAIVAGELDISQVVVHCDVCANPAPSYSWTFNGTSLSDTGDKITLDALKPEHIGFYQCTVSNTLSSTGQETRAYTIQVIPVGRPYAPTDFRVLSNRTSISLTPSWKPGFHGGVPPMHFKLAYKISTESDYTLVQDDIPDIQTPDGQVRYTVTGLTAETAYSFRIYAVNNRTSGVNRSSNVTTQGTTKKTPEVNITSVAVTDKSELEVRWTFSGYRRKRSVVGETIVYVVVQYRRVGESQFNEYPEDGTKIPASNQIATVPGDFDKGNQYEVQLVVYEGNLKIGSGQSKPGINPLPPQTNGRSNIGAIVGGVVGGIAILVIIVVIVLVVMRKRPSLPDKESTVQRENPVYVNTDVVAMSQKTAEEVYEVPDAVPVPDPTIARSDSNGEAMEYEYIDQGTRSAANATAAVYEPIDQGTRSPPAATTPPMYDSLQQQYASLDSSTRLPPAPPSEYGKLHIYGNVQ